ncbi:MAG: lytic transglycosylase domain-containing protein [Betaproteobacteria bacterium]|nr:lytic transglycosylase domain-containing protein [Betaproteobacteria bacterium]
MSYLAIKIGAWAITGLAAFVLLWDASAPPERKLQPGEQITTVLNSVVPPTIALTPIATTTTAVPKGCAQYVADAISAGWPAEQAPTLARVMFRESRCIPTAYNAKDSNGGSRGLMQINGTHKRWLMQLGYINNLDDLYNPDINLRAALHLWRMVGWSAWALPNP